MTFSITTTKRLVSTRILTSRVTANTTIKPTRIITRDYRLRPAINQRQQLNQRYIPQNNRSFHQSSVKMVHNLKTLPEFHEAVKANKIVVVDCFATWCGPCKVIAPHFVKYEEKHNNAHFVKIDVDESPDIAQELGVTAMPTFIIYKDGEIVNKIVGADPNKLGKAIEEATA